MVNNLEFVQMDWRINNIRRGLVRSVCSTRVAILLLPITRGRNMARSAGWMDGGGWMSVTRIYTTWNRLLFFKRPNIEGSFKVFVFHQEGGGFIAIFQ